MAALQEREFLCNRIIQIERQIAGFKAEELTADSIPDMEAHLKYVEKCQNRFLELHSDICKRMKDPARIEEESHKLNEFLMRCHNSEMILETCLQKLQPKTTEEKSTMDHTTLHMLMKSMFEQQNSTMNEMMGVHKVNMETVTSCIKNQATPKRRMKLPQVQLPPFSGKLSEWQPYHDLFVSMIHNNDDYVLEEKFFYLKTSLTGEAAATIKHLAPTEANYKDAWELLVSRYNKPNNIVFDYIKTFFAQSKKAATNPAELRQSFNTFEEVTRAVDALKTSTRDPWLIYVALDALDTESQGLWARTQLENDIPTWDEFLRFLEKRCDSWATCWDRRPDSKSTKGTIGTKTVQSQKSSQPTSTFVATVDETKSCPICSVENHHVSQCPSLINSSPEHRLEKVKASKLCFNCLRGSHGARDCRSSWCRKCNAKHNTLLHEAFVSINASSTIQSQPENESAKPTEQPTDPVPNTLVNHVVAHVQGYKYMMLPTVQILVTGHNGQKHIGRALLDSCSQTNTMTRKFAEKLELPLRTSQVGVIKGIGATSTHTPQSVSTEIEDRNRMFSMILDFLVIEHITDDQPATAVKMPYEIPSHITLADPDFNKPGRIDILLGAEVFMNALRSHKIAGSPTLQETVFGYIVAGCFQSQTTSVNAASHLITCLCATEDTSLHNQLEKFWTLEEVPSQRILSTEEQKCEEHFNAHTHRDSQGRYVVRMPVRDNISKLGDSRQMAERRLRCVERRLQRDKGLYAQYRDFMRQYEELGHMRLLPTGYASPMPVVYLSHHPVIKESTTTPVRVVFDASAKTSTGLSLNSTLMVGAKTQDDLFDILLRFRQYNVIIKADIQKMYRQIKIHEDDQGMMRILWRESADQPIQTYLLSTVTYGTACAPFLATRCLKKLATDESKNFPIAAPIVETDFYVDDLLTGTADSESALILVQELTTMLQCGGFTLKKWSSNSSEVMTQIPAEDHDQSVTLNMDHEEDIKTLGLYFNPNSDNFRFLTTEFHSIVTRRTMLSDTAKTYDPMGFLSPITITAKILMQSLWNVKVDWDSPLPDDVCHKWLEYQINLKEAVSHIKIPRQITSIKQPQSIQLFGFSDASERAYAACVYARVTDCQNTVTSRLLCAKTKVAPRKQVSLPRLELCGALLLARLTRRIQSALTVTVSEVYAFTDSTIVLCWINGESHRWKTFVANRVAQIQDVVPASNWSHVISEENPADVATRGIAARDIITEDSMWFEGPSWITNTHINLQSPDFDQIDNVQLEIRNTTSLVSTNSVLAELIARFSSFSKLVRCVAYWQRFITNRLRKIRNQDLIIGRLTPSELSQSRTFIVRQVQKESFSEDYQNLNSGRVISRGSRLMNLNPFVDGAGVMRVGGRIRHADVHYDFKHPVLLPSHHHLTHLIALDSHEATFHGGAQKTLAYMRRRYWPLRGINVVKRIIRGCVPCFRVKPKAAQQLMSDCHISRVSAVHPFHRTGVDFCGPFLIRTPVRSKTRLKMYVALFICLATRAVHIELVTDLTSSAFIASLRRFAARRGKPAEVLCDNATNFIGASRELLELKRLLETHPHQSHIIDASANQGIDFKFIPPRSPHFGGSWESSIKAVKHHLHRTVGNSHFTEEEMLTILAQIEGCLNSRPLTPMSTDPSDLEVLTPGHFLIGRPLDAVPDENLTMVPENRLKAWKLVQQRLQFFWSRWSNEYLHTLQQRRKWSTEHPSLQPGDLVTIQEEHVPPMKWSLGRVVECFPGVDGNVRVASVKTANGIYRRAITRLCPLPMDVETQKSSLLPGQNGDGHVPERSADKAQSMS